MGLHAICGLPGSGKTEAMTALAIKHYKRTNRPFKRYIRKRHNLSEYVNNVYTNYPVLLDSKHQIYSNIVDIDDLDCSYRFLPNALIALDETQLKYDSMEYKNFPRSIPRFLQAHRHFNIKEIYLATQHPNRLVVYMKNIITNYDRFYKSIKIPFTPYKLSLYKRCYELEDYPSIMTRNKEEKMLKDISTHFLFMNEKKVHSSYDTCYLAPLNAYKPLINNGKYVNLKLTDKQCKEYGKLFYNEKKEKKNNTQAQFARNGVQRRGVSVRTIDSEKTIDKPPVTDRGAVNP